MLLKGCVYIFILAFFYVRLSSYFNSIIFILLYYWLFEHMI